ncbi:metalloregulator ArsR/SmtB family transcription factor [Gordonia bronchialis]|uniref:ArsR/SmtB family transcription factor n=1 Tax=Gordonia bronchialis TaxID=2054 RepID=UPI001CBF65A3|nr:metalloregulator ArsR/SmtB family transcription factor [Gordonia bronchialis]UAK39694.1 metalloregulator ArsR/SmtB family transcription factor [Gordonia bronchialis]
MSAHELDRRQSTSARTAASELLRALASPTRIAIVQSLGSESRCVHELVGELELSQPLVSQHLRVLKDAGVVRGERNGREIMYSLVDHHIVHIVDDALVHATEEPTTEPVAAAPAASDDSDSDPVAPDAVAPDAAATDSAGTNSARTNSSGTATPTGAHTSVDTR